MDSAKDAELLVNTKYRGKMSLHIAVEAGYVEMVPLLLKYGAKIEAVDEQGRTPLILASSGYDERAEITKILLENGAKIDAIDNEKKTALIHASYRGYTNTVNIHLDHGANIEAIDNQKKTPLIHASEQGHEKTTTTLLDRNANIEATNNKGETPLMLAHTYTVDILLDRGAKIEAIDQYERTALMLASEKWEKDKVKKLLDHGANSKAVDQYGRTPLMFASIGFKYWWKKPPNILYALAIITKLLDNGADIDAIDKKKKTALRLAIENMHPAIANRLLDLGAKIETTNTDHVKTTLALVNAQLLQIKTEFENNSVEEFNYRRIKRSFKRLRTKIKKHERNQKGSFISRCRLMFSSSSTPSLKVAN